MTRVEKLGDAFKDNIIYRETEKDTYSACELYDVITKIAQNERYFKATGKVHPKYPHLKEFVLVDTKE